MHLRSWIFLERWRTSVNGTLGFCLCLALCQALSVIATDALAQTPAHSAPVAIAPTLRMAFESAWARQPEAAALSARRNANQALQQAATSWTPEPVAVELSGKTDALKANLGTREYAGALAIPLWLPGERNQNQMLAEAEGRALESRTLAAQLVLATVIREAWWQGQRARSDADAARAQLDNARKIAADVEKRLKAGDLAQSDQHQAAGAVATAEVFLAQAHTALVVAQETLRALTAMPGLTLNNDLTSIGTEADPTAGPITDLDAHSNLHALRDRAAVAEGLSALTATQSRTNPELMIGTTRDRGAFGDAWQQTITLGVRIPFGAGPRFEARKAAARAEVIELQAQLSLERARLSSDYEGAKTRTMSARAQIVSAERRAQLARESRRFFEKSFSLGETDLPTRLRIEAEAGEAQRQAARAHIELAASISSLRQAQGMLP